MTRGGRGRDGMLLTWSGGSWKAARALIPITVRPGPDVGLEGVSCLSRSSWTVVGQYQDVDGRGEAQASCSPVWLSQDVTGSVRSGTWSGLTREAVPADACHHGSCSSRHRRSGSVPAGPLWPAISNPGIVSDVARLVDGARANGDLVVWVLYSERGVVQVPHQSRQPEPAAEDRSHVLPLILRPWRRVMPSARRWPCRAAPAGGAGGN